VAQFATNAPPGMYFEPAASFFETAIGLLKKAGRLKSAGRRSLQAHKFWNEPASVPELTRNADIKLNTRVSLRPIQTGLACPQVAQIGPQFCLRTARLGVASCPRGGPAPHVARALLNTARLRFNAHDLSSVTRNLFIKSAFFARPPFPEGCTVPSIYRECANMLTGLGILAALMFVVISAVRTSRR
jgi:hypothetical protein